MPIVTAHALTKSYGTHRILDGVSFAIDDGTRYGLIGSNGAGKSTLARIIAGLDEPDTGTVARRRDASIAYLSQEPQLQPGATAYQEVERGLAAWRSARDAHHALSERIARGDAVDDTTLAEQSELAAEIERLGGWDQGHRVEAMLAHLGIERTDQLVDSMSGGERRRVALARILVSQPRLAILDEPTNHLDAETCDWLEAYLVDEFEGALLLITHDRYFLDRVVTNVFEIDRGKVTTFEGNYERYLELKAERLEHEARVQSNRMNLLRRERDWLSRRAPARTSKQKARIGRAEALERSVDAARRDRSAPSFEIAATKSGQRVVEIEHVSMRWPGRDLFRDVNLTVAPGERVGIIGRNGTGKTTLLRIVLGEITPTEGRVILGPQTRVMYFDQQRAGIDDEKSVFDNVSEGADKVRLGDADVNVHAYLDRFLFDGGAQRQRAGSLSGGERARLALAKMLRGGASLVLLDEPTNDLDLISLSMLEELLVTFSGSVLVVTHDRYFLDRIATSILAFEPDGRVVRYAGNFSDARLQRERILATSRELPKAVPARASEPPRPRRGLTLREEKELSELPARIDAAESDIAALETQLNDPTLYAARGGEVPAIQQRLESARRDRDGLMARWEELEQRKTDAGR